MGKTPDYAILTSARNESDYLGTVIRSVLSQTVRPLVWVIVSDGSTDDTYELASSAARDYGFIMPVMRSRGLRRNFSSQASALNEAYQRIKDSSFEYVATLDADVALPPNYYEIVISRMERNARVGVSGGHIREMVAGMFGDRRTNRPYSVPGAIQVFRRICWEQIGGLKPLKYGGLDTYAENSARLHDWEVIAHSDLPVSHFRPRSGSLNSIPSYFQTGKMDYNLGYMLPFEIAKCLRRLPDRPRVAAAIAQLAGYMQAWYENEDRVGPSAYRVRFRREQMYRAFGYRQSRWSWGRETNRET